MYPRRRQGQVSNEDEKKMAFTMPIIIYLQSLFQIINVI